MTTRVIHPSLRVGAFSRRATSPLGRDVRRAGRWAWVALSAALALGCSSNASPERVLQATETASYSRGGNSSIDGRVVLRSPSGERPASIDTHVYMTPATTAALARYHEYAIVKNELPDRPTSQLWRVSRTDAQGGFTFSNLAPGEYILVSEIVWAAPNTPKPLQTLAHARVRVPAGAKVSVVLAGDATRAK